MKKSVVDTDLPFAAFAMEADIDYLLARHIASIGAAFQGRAGFFSQQALEKYLKALSVQSTAKYLETHNLLDLAKFAAESYPVLKDERLKRHLERFDMFDQVGRYGAAAKFDPMSKGKSFAGIQTNPTAEVKIAGSWVWTGKDLFSLDEAVFNIRGILNFEKIGFADQLLSVLLKSNNTILTGTWTCPIPIFDVLTTNNSYFNPSVLQEVAASKTPDK